MAKPTSTGSRRSRLRLAALLVAVAVAVAATLAGGAFADNLNDNAGTIAGITTITAGGSGTTITYQLVATNNDATGCDATSSKPVTVTITKPSAVTGPASLSFTSCGPTNGKTATFSSNTAGTYAITHSISGGVSGSTFNNNADFTLTVNPATPTNTAPTLTLPSNKTVEATSASGATVTYTATASDTEDGTLTPSCAPASGSTFTLGITQVNCSVTDSGGLTTTGQFNVTVQDTTAPTLTLPADKTVEATGSSGAVVTYSASATDAVDGTDSVLCSPTSGSTFPLGPTQVSCSATDAHSNTATGSFNVTVQDTTAPALSLPADKTVEATGPSGAVVTYSATASDLVDGTVAVDCTPASGSTFSLGTTEVDCSSTDAHSNSANGNFNVTVEDTTPPGDGSITINGGATWTNDPSVSLDLSATDAVGVTSYRLAESAAGLDTASTVAVTSDTSFSATNVAFSLSSGDSAAKTVYVRFFDAAGNSSDVHSSIGLDTVKPKITGHTGTYVPGTWTNQSVTVSFTCADDQGSANSGIAGNSIAGATLTNSGANQSVTNSGGCADAAGNAADAVTVSNIDIDKVAPSVTCDSVPNGWQADNVTINCTAGDGLSGLADSLHDGSFSLSTSVLAGSADSAAAFSTHTVQDIAGNQTVAGAGLTAMIDKQKPTVTLACSGVPATIHLGDNVSLQWTASDGSGSGVASGYGSGSITLDTSTIGAQSTQVAAGASQDNVGNTSGASNSCSYSVTYNFAGFFQPVDNAPTCNTVKAGSAIPVKFSLHGYQGMSIFSQQPTAASGSCIGDPVDPVETTVTAGSSSLSYDATSDQYIYVWKTDKNWAGQAKRLTIYLADGTTEYARFNFTK